MTWEGLELPSPIGLEDRRARASRKVDELCAALTGMTRDQVEDLMITVVSLCHAWVTAPNLNAIIAGDGPGPTRRRSAIAATAASLAGVEA